MSRFILHIKGHQNRDKYGILNRALICFVRNHKTTKAASGEADVNAYAYKCQSSTWYPMLKTIFLYFGKHGAQYKHPTNFMAGRGTYTAVLNQKFAIIAKSRIDYDSTPNRSSIDLDSFKKICVALRGRWPKPYNNFSHLNMLVNFLMGVMFMLCGCENKHISPRVTFEF